MDNATNVFSVYPAKSTLIVRFLSIVSLIKQLHFIIELLVICCNIKIISNFKETWICYYFSVVASI